MSDMLNDDDTPIEFDYDDPISFDDEHEDEVIEQGDNSDNSDCKTPNVDELDFDDEDLETSDDDVSDSFTDEDVDTRSQSVTSKENQELDADDLHSTLDEEQDFIDELDNEETISREQYEEALTALEKSEKRYEMLLKDWENYKRRTAEELEREKELACSSIATNLLPVLDDLERAIDHARQNDHADIANGMMSIYKKAILTYHKHGIERLYPQGEEFDSNMHMAVQKTDADEADVEPETVTQVLQCGYAMGDKILRPAMVVVAV